MHSTTETETEMRHLIWAHRGASGYAPENTLPAFRLAADLGADGVELDVQYTKDRKLVVVHDEMLGRTAEGSGWICEHDFADLRKRSFSLTFPDYGRTEIPLLEEVLDLLRETGLTVNIELKTSIFDYPGIEEDTVRMVRQMGYQDRVLYSSFNHYSMLRLKAADPSAKTAFLYMDTPIDVVSYAVKHGADAIHPALYNVRIPGVMEECRRAGIAVNVWTANTDAEFAACDAWGTDAVITNYPDRARAYFEKDLL